MTDLEYLSLAEAAFKQIEQTCDRFNDELDVDIDNQRVGNMLTLTFDGKSQIVINLQKPLHEIWMAVRAGGYHYRWVDRNWVDTKTGSSFWSDLSRHASDQSACSLSFDGPIGL